MLRVDSYDGLHCSFGPNQSQISANSSLSSSILDDDPLDQPVCIHADSLESLDEMMVVNEAADLMAFMNTSALCDDLRFIMGMPEICDVKFLVGKDKVPVYGVKAILATRSRVLYEMIIAHQKSQNDGSMKKKPKKENKILSKLKKLRGKKEDRPKHTGSDKLSSGHLTIDIEEFDSETFRRVVLYLQCGNTNVNLQTVIGVMNAADTYGLEELRSACFQFACKLVNHNTVLSLLSKTDQYGEYKWTKYIILEIMDFICEKAQDVLRLPGFARLSKKSAILILGRSDLKATEESKWDAALEWSKRHCRKPISEFLRETIEIFTPRINFNEIPLSRLRQEIRPMNVLPDNVINKAILNQAGDRLVIGREKEQTVSRRSSRRPRRNSGDSRASIRGFIRRKLSSVSSISTSSRARGYDSGFASSSEFDEEYML